ncbi:MAG TPA: FkbM family methyltransferase [Gaiellaceae bacterium]|nr:FkbM family methyltransferase [Gaiellaceae bacterium]
MIVVDLGCFPHRHEVSVEPLVEHFRPDVLYGFDPWPELAEGETRVGGTRVVLERKAAWIEDGEIEFAWVRGLRSWDSTVMRAKNSRGEWSGSGSREVIRVPCFDFSAWLRSMSEPPVVKMDVEGAEFPILERMVREGTDALVAELLVEWHDEKMDDFAERKELLLETLRCPVSDWDRGRTSRIGALLGLLPRSQVRGGR